MSLIRPNNVCNMFGAISYFKDYKKKQIIRSTYRKQNYKYVCKNMTDIINIRHSLMMTIQPISKYLIREEL